MPIILVADIAGDTSGEVGARVATCLDGFQSYEVFRTKQVLKLGDKGIFIDKLIVAAEEGRAWMRAENADLLVWGEMAGSLVVLRFLVMVPMSENQPGAYGLGDVLALPATFSGDLNSALHAVVLSAVGPTFKGMRTRVGAELDKALAQIKPLVQEKPEALSGGNYAAFLGCVGNAFAAHGLLGGPEKRLDQAISSYKLALAHASAQADSVVWSITQNHLGAALKAKGERTKDVDVLKEASKAYKAIAEQLNRIGHPFDWAMANINLGQVLYRLGVMSSETAYYQEATRFFDEALTIYTREGTPGKWAEVCNQYGVVLLALGEQVNGNVTLEVAVKKFRASLHVRKKEVVPVLWAQTANNLGAACFSLAKRNSELALLREASSCFEGAIEIYQNSGAGKKADLIANNLSRVQRLLASRDGS
ncbi:MAG: hypothetical protein HQ483_06830 [Rhodospirillales bacterium]|nr:hypothetical protein [Rhodospirillales bacterium]